MIRRMTRAMGRPGRSAARPVVREFLRGLRLIVAGLASATVLLLGACSPSTSGTRPEAPVEPVIVRPVVVAEKGVEELVKAIALLKDGQYRQAEANLEEIVKVRPELAEAQLNLGWVKQRLGKHKAAISHLEEGARLKPDEPAALRLIALSQRELGEFTAAEGTYAKALERFPNDDKLLLNTAILYDIYLFQPLLALDYYRRYQALQSVPDPKVAGWIALIERQGGKP